MTPEKLSKLPKWAQEEFENLQQQLKDASLGRAKAEAAINGGKISHINVDGYGLEPSIYLPENAPVKFELTPNVRGRIRSISVSFTQDRERLRIQSNWEEMSIHPRAANVIEVEERRD